MLLRRLNVVIAKSFHLQTFSPRQQNLIKVRSMNEAMKEAYVEINSVPSHIYTWGQWIEDKFDDKFKKIVLIVTGNPGLPGFYTIFADSLYKELNKEVPIWVIGHAGHDEPKKDMNMPVPPLKGNENLYNLDGQLRHKNEFITRFVPKDVKVYLLGHSVGAKFCLDLLKFSSISSQVVQSYLMFPTIERIGESKKGLLVPKYNRFFFLFRIFYNTFHLMPTSWKRTIVRWHCRRDGMPEEFLESSLEYTNPSVIDRIWFLALEEMEKIRDIDEETFKNNMGRLKLYYGAKDDWVRTEYYHELVERFPGVDAQLCEQGYEHAFVLKSGVEVGKMVSGWIKQNDNQGL